MFVSSDIYTGSGSVILYNCWTNAVTKFGSNDFYNWEEDNEPLYDLDERTYLAWEKLGFPTSCIPGLALTVSANAPASAFDCNSNIFPTVSAAIAALPQALCFPVLIEVANFGSLGALELHNIKCTGNGSIEIINRNFVRSYAPSALVTNDFPGPGDYGDFVIANQISSLDVSTTLIQNKCLHISSLVWSGANDARAAGNMRAVVMDKIQDGTEAYNQNISVSLSSAQFFGSSPNYFNVSAYEGTLDIFDSPVTNVQADASSFNPFTFTLAYRDGTITNKNCDVALYANYFDKVSIKNCEGPIYIRGFCADGVSNTLRRSLGFIVENSTNIYLENVLAARYTEAGFKFTNSVVNILRGITAYRCYQFDNTGARLAGSFYGHMDKEFHFKDKAAGLYALNSVINFSSTLSMEPSGVSAYDFMVGFCRNANGIVLENSKLTGGIKRTNLAEPKSQSYYAIMWNADYGIYCRNGIIDLDGRLEVVNNTRGLRAENSNIFFDECTFEYNQREGLHLINSNVLYNKNFQKPTQFAGTTDNYRQFEFRYNGQHLRLESNSTFYPNLGPSACIAYEKMKFDNSWGADNIWSELTTKAAIPSVEIDSGSEAIFVNCKINKGDLASIPTAEPAYGLGIAIKNNSKAHFIGTSGACTVIAGPNDYAYQKKAAGVYALNNSEVEFNGPTLIAQFAVDVLADGNSVMTFQPQRDKQTGSVDKSTWLLSDTRGHTSVELHATKACLVADKGSIINIRDLGNYPSLWSGTNGVIAVASSLDYRPDTLEISSLILRGSMQFYPNPNDENDYNNGIGIDDVQASTTSREAFSQYANTYNYNLSQNPFIPANADQLSSITAGGMCIRAVGGSKVNILNVNFPCGWWNASGIIYDTSGADAGNLLCNRTFIWNIADNSYLNAAYLSVSSNYPKDVGYHGPRAIWLSGAGAVAYGAPPSTPDTSSLSVLDMFGSGQANTWNLGGGNTTRYGVDGFENQGPFRLYVSPHSASRYLTGPNNTPNVYGFPYQVFAQGYNFSGNLSAAPTVSSLFGLIIQNNNNALTTSGFYYCSAFVEDSANRVMLDESAANTLANAKNGATGKSGRNKICTIYQAHKSLAGEAQDNSTTTYGRGFKSANVFDLSRSV